MPFNPGWCWNKVTTRKYLVLFIVKHTFEFWCQAPILNLCCIFQHELNAALGSSFNTRKWPPIFICPDDVMEILKFLVLVPQISLSNSIVFLLNVITKFIQILSVLMLLNQWVQSRLCHIRKLSNAYFIQQRFVNGLSRFSALFDQFFGHYLFIWKGSIFHSWNWWLHWLFAHKPAWIPHNAWWISLYFLQFNVFLYRLHCKILQFFQFWLLHFLHLASQACNNLYFRLFFYCLFLWLLLKRHLPAVFQFFQTNFLTKLLHRLNDVCMKLLQLLLVQVIRLWFTIRPSLWKLVALMTFLGIFGLLLHLLLFYLFDHFSCFLRHVTEGLFSGTLFIALLLLCS